MSAHGAGPRILLYSHDTYGLGHLRRSLAVAGALSRLRSAPTILLATGSPRTQAFDLPPRCDTVKLPALTKTPAGRYRSRTLALPVEETVRLRAELLRAAARAFRPDLVLVDHAPAGASGELLPLLEDAAGWATPPRLVLALRDVIDEAEQVRREWLRAGVWPLLEQVYDRILVYGDPAVLTTAQELELPERFPGRVRFVGYLGRPVARGTARPPRRDDVSSIVVTPGGGGDGQQLLRGYASFLAALPEPARFRSVVVTGPLLSPRRRREMSRSFRSLPHPVELLAFTGGMERLVRGASGVVAMAGYNTVAEILSAPARALLVPREVPRREQLIRAERLSRVADLEVCRADELGAAPIGGFVERALAGGAASPPRVRLDGLETTAREIDELLDRGESGDRVLEGARRASGVG